MLQRIQLQKNASIQTNVLTMKYWTRDCTYHSRNQICHAVGYRLTILPRKTDNKFIKIHVVAILMVPPISSIYFDLFSIVELFYWYPLGLFNHRHTVTYRSLIRKHAKFTYFILRWQRYVT